MYTSFFKRVFDIMVSLIGLLLLSPLLILVSICLLFTNQGKPFFAQVRPGKNEKLFTILKFKTMNDKKDTHGNILPDNERLTKIGSIIRKSSLDEIPQLLNVLIGDMSLIGPRPLMPQYLPLYNITQKKRHNVKPGITGWAQVNGRNGITWEQQFDLDVYYVHNISFKLDLKILVKTIFRVIKKEGINSNADSRTFYFEGSDK